MKRRRLSRSHSPRSSYTPKTDARYSTDSGAVVAPLSLSAAPSRGEGGCCLRGPGRVNEGEGDVAELVGSEGRRVEVHGPEECNPTRNLHSAPHWCPAGSERSQGSQFATCGL